MLRVVVAVVEEVVAAEGRRVALAPRVCIEAELPTGRLGADAARRVGAVVLAAD